MYSGRFPVLARGHSAAALKDSHEAEFAARQLEKLMISKEEASEALRKAMAERDEATADWKRATERVNKAVSRLNSALMLNAQFVKK